MMTYRRVFNNPDHIVAGCSRHQVLEPGRLDRERIVLKFLEWCVTAFLEHDVEHGRERGDGARSIVRGSVDCV